MQIALLIIIALSALVLIASTMFIESNDAGMGSIMGGSASESLFGKTKSKGLQATLKRVAVVASAVFVLAIMIYGIIS